jgi:hypothetical protein
MGSGVLITVLCLAALLVTPAPPAAAAPVINVTPAVRAAWPQQVPLASSGLTTRITVTVSSSEPVASATASTSAPDGGLVVSHPNQPLGTLAQPVTMSFDVAATTPGLHTLFVLVGASGGYVGGAVLRYVWASGSPLPAGTGGLDKRSFGWEGTEHVAGLESSTRAVRMLSILGPTYAFVGLPAHGLPKCRQPGNGCVPYSYDSSSNLVQVGTDIIGSPHVSGLYTDGLVAADEQDGGLFGRYDFQVGLAAPRQRTSLAGTYAYSSRDYPTGITFERVTFRDDRTYDLAYAVDGGKVHKLSGTFRLGKRGAITFWSGRKVAQLGTVLVGKRLHGSPAPHLGLWLVLSGKKGKTPDGNLLVPVQRK